MLTPDLQEQFDRILSDWENDSTQLADEKRKTLPQNQSIADELLVVDFNTKKGECVKNTMTCFDLAQESYQMVLT